MSERSRGKDLDATVSAFLRDTLVLDNIRDAVVLVDADRKIRLWNPGAERLFGWSSDELIGKPYWLRLPHASSGLGTESVCQRLCVSDWDGEYEDYRKDGTRVWVEARVRRAINAEGQLIGFIGIFHDITERRMIEASIKEHRDRLQLALSAAKMAVWARDLETGQITWSKEASALFPGLAFDSDPRLIQDMIHSEDQPKLMTTVQQALQDGEPHSCELRMVGRDQRIRTMSFLGQLCTDAAGRPVSLVGTIQDVTIQRRGELLLLGQNRILDRIAKGAPLQDVLREVVCLVESLLHSVLCSILIKDAEGKSLRLLAAPSMSATFNEAVQTVPIGPTEGACGTCAFLGAPVHATDIATDPRWDRYRHLVLPIGIRSCLSVPIVASDAHGKGSTEAVSPHSVIGTFALYRTSDLSEEQQQEEEAVLKVAAQLAGVAIERDLAMQRITESEERYRRLLEVVPAAIVVITESRITFCNQALLAVAGYQDRSQIIGQDIRVLVTPEQYSEVEKTMVALLEGKIQQSSDDDYLVRRDGTLVPVQSVATVIWDRGRRAVMVALLDRTEQRRSDELLRSIMSSVTDAIITTDEHGQIVSANAATARLFEYEVSDLIGQNIALLIPASAEPAGVSQATQACIASPSHVTAQELSGRQKSGRTFPADVLVSSFLLNQKPHFTRVVRDISARRKLEEQLRQSQKMEAIGQLAGGIAHDFNNLLTVINGYSDRILDRLPAGDPLHDAAADVRAAGERAASLTSQLLAFSRRAIIEPKLLDLNRVVQSEVRMLRRLIGENITIITQLRPGIPQIKIDPIHLEQVLLNLALNARDAMGQGGRLVIATSVIELRSERTESSLGPLPGRYVQLTIQDNGSGMTEEVKQRIFEPFFTTKGVGKGSGLGLATVYGVVHQAGGHVSFDSVFGKGSTFRVLLPAQVRESSVRSMTALVGAPVGKETVLLAEDADVVRKLIRQTLEMLGYTVLDADSGQQALDLEAGYKGPIDLLLTDVVMSDFGGKKLADAICQRRPSIKVLFMSGYTDDALTRYGVESSQSAFLPKPFTAPTLARIVRDVLDNRHDATDS